MTQRLLTIVFLSSLFCACDPSSSGGGGGSGGGTATDTSTGGATDTTTSDTGGTMSTSGSGGATTTSSETGGVGGATTTSTTTSALCMDGGQGSAMGTIYPSDCPCRPEAEAYLPQIAQAVIQSYESAGALCASAVPVPAIVPAGVGYFPATLDGMDFHTGDDQNGWVCAGWSPPAGFGVHCQFGFSVGSGYVGPIVGGPDPGADGFEVWARGDTNGDVILSTFTLPATFDPQTGTYALGPMFEHQPDE